MLVITGQPLPSPAEEMRYYLDTVLREDDMAKASDAQKEKETEEMLLRLGVRRLMKQGMSREEAEKRIKKALHSELLIHLPTFDELG